MKNEVDERIKIEEAFTQVFGHHYETWQKKQTPLPVTEDDFSCYQQLINLFKNHCSTNEYQMKFYGMLVAECKFREGQLVSYEDYGNQLK